MVLGCSVENSTWLSVWLSSPATGQRGLNGSYARGGSAECHKKHYGKEHSVEELLLRCLFTVVYVLQSVT